jgi:cell division protein FtsN
MTINHPELHQGPKLIETRPAKLEALWLSLGALSVVAGLAYATGALTGSKHPVSRDAGAPALVVAQKTNEKLEHTAPIGARSGEPTEGDTAKVVDQAGPGTKQPLDEAATHGAFYVRVASYKGKDDAAAYAAALSARGLRAHSSPDPEGSAWQLVRLGPFQFRADAEKARFELKIHERLKAYVQPRSNGKYHVQVGSFSTLEQAELVEKRFAAQGHATKISRIKMGDQRWHCVRIGPFDTAEEATAYQALVKTDAESVVIPYGPPKI